MKTPVSIPFLIGTIVLLVAKHVTSLATGSLFTYVSILEPNLKSHAPFDFESFSKKDNLNSESKFGELWKALSGTPPLPEDNFRDDDNSTPQAPKVRAAIKLFFYH